MGYFFVVPVRRIVSPPTGREYKYGLHSDFSIKWVLYSWPERCVFIVINRGHLFPYLLPGILFAAR